MCRCILSAAGTWLEFDEDLLHFSLHLFVAVYFLLHVLGWSLMNNPRSLRCTGLLLFTLYLMFGVVV